MAFVREEALLGFELRLAYENGRLALDPPGEGPRSSEAAQVVQLRGHGAVVLELAWRAGEPALHRRRGTLLVRREWIVGWLGPAGAARPAANRVAERAAGPGRVLGRAAPSSSARADAIA